jgi:hypothetical protein
MDRPLQTAPFPEEKRRRFKAAVAREGKTMSQVLFELVENYTQEQENRERGTADAGR